MPRASRNDNNHRRIIIINPRRDNDERVVNLTLVVAGSHVGHTPHALFLLSPGEPYPDSMLYRIIRVIIRKGVSRIVPRITSAKENVLRCSKLKTSV